MISIIKRNHIVETYHNRDFM